MGRGRGEGETLTGNRGPDLTWVFGGTGRKVILGNEEPRRDPGKGNFFQVQLTRKIKAGRPGTREVQTQGVRGENILKPVGTKRKRGEAKGHLGANKTLALGRGHRRFGEGEIKS